MILQELIANNTLPNALLFTGGDLQEMFQSAREMAITLMGEPARSRIETENHPDFSVIRTDGKSATHSIENLRNLIDEVYLPPFEAKVKVFVIEDAHRMQTPSANALLKTLEEPLSSSIIVLITTEPESLLPTITSRLRKIAFTPTSKKTDEEIPQLIAALFREKGCYPEWLKILTQIEKFAEDDEENRHAKIDELLQTILYWYRDLQILAGGLDPSLLYNEKWKETLLLQLQKGTPPSLESIFHSLEKCRFALQHNVKLRVCLHELLV